MLLCDLIDLEKERAPWVLEPLLFARYTERLARKATAKNIMRGDGVYRLFALSDLGDVPEWYLAKVYEVGPPGVLVPLTREYAAPFDLLSG